MQPTHAEIARTLAAGHLPGTAHVFGHPGPLPVRHVTDARGRVLLLAPRDGALPAAVRPAGDAGDTAMVLEVADVPPVAGSPALGRVWLSGWVVPLDGDEARAAALDYADTDACGDLLDVGAGQVLHRMTVAEVRYEHGGARHEVDLDAYARARPDPLSRIEFDLITDLAEHHRAELGAYVRRHLGRSAQPVAEPRVVRLDRYGFLLRLDDRLARLAFARPVTGRHDLAHLLHPVLCHRCTADSAGATAAG